MNGLPSPNQCKAEGPQPLLRDIPPGRPYPVKALGPLKGVVEAVQGMTLAPIAIPAASALAVASLAVQGFCDVETLGGTRPLSLYVLTVATSGERKSSCDAPLDEWERLSEWDRYGPAGRPFCGLCKAWVDRDGDCVQDGCWKAEGGAA